MIEKTKYEGELYGKKTISFKIDELKDLRQLKKQYPSKQLYYFKDGCVSFRTLDSIKESLKGKTIVTKDKKTISLFDYHMDKGNITKLFNNYLFNCNALRGYSNTYEIVWQTEKEYITVTTKNNLWFDVTQTIETDKDKYAENTVTPVKLISLHPQILTGDIAFEVIRWSGGNTTTYNTYQDPDYIQTFNKNLFYSKGINKKT